MIVNAVRLSEIDHGVAAPEWKRDADISIEDFIEEYFSKYLSYTKIDKDCTYMGIDTENYLGPIDLPTGCIYLNDGTKFGTCEEIDIIFFDVNGDKGPNKFGRDVFLFNILSYDGGLPSLANNVPHFNTIATWPEYWKENSTLKDEYTREKCIENCMSRPSGSYCTHLLELDGWEFKEDYPLRI